jgi:hypothetical protein
MDFIKTVTFDEHLIGSLYSHPIFYADMEFSLSLQSKLVMEHNFPYSFDGRFDLTLLNSAFNSGIHFFDVYSKELKKYFSIGDLTSVPPHLLLYVQFIFHHILAFQPVLYSRFEEMQTLLNSKLVSSVMNDTLQRMKNDYRLLTMIGFITNNDVSIHDLMLHSLPYLLQYALGNPQILDYSGLRVFAVLDTDMQTDFDFMRCYRLLRLFLGCFRAPSKSLKQSLEGIKAMLDSITNKTTQHLAITELFSCLFIQKNEKYVCHQYVAQKLVRLLEVTILHLTSKGRMQCSKHEKQEKKMLPVSIAIL